MSRLPNTVMGLATPDGVFAMLALDQRESLRAYLTAAGADDSDAAIIGFKRSALEDLGRRASAVLLDLDFGIPALDQADPDALAGGLILAADRLVQDDHGTIVDTDLDERVDAALVERTGALALKLLLIWDTDAERRAALRLLTQRFLKRCRELGVLSVVETLMTMHARTRARATDGGHLYEEMAADVADLGIDVYKTEVPGDPTGPLSVVTERARAITALLPCPWVLLSNGVAPEEFATIVDAVCAGGASGFLAGRAVWRPALGAAGYEPTRGAAARLDDLIALVTDHGRQTGDTPE